MVFLSTYKPLLILKVSDKGIKIIDYYLLFSYSLLFSVLTGIIVLFTVSEFTTKKSKTYIKHNFKSYTSNVYTYSPK